MWKCGNVKMWKWAGSRHFERSLGAKRRDEVRNLTESSAINIEINNVEPIYLVPINGTRFLTLSASGGLRSK